jgi:hypothetical protein
MGSMRSWRWGIGGAALLMLALACGVLWSVWPPRSLPSVAVMVPLAPDCSLHLLIGPFPAESLPTALDLHLRREGPARFMLGVWYQATGPGTPTLDRLLLLEIPRWPLIALAAGATIAGGACGRRRGGRI